MDTIQEAVAVLASRTPDEIRDFLMFVGCKGIPRLTFRCPIANYLFKFTGESAVVNCFEIFVSNKFVMKTPENVAKFIRAVDANEYPELDITR